MVPLKSHFCSWHQEPSCIVTCWHPAPRFPGSGQQHWCQERVKESHATFTFPAIRVSFCRAIWLATVLSEWQDVINRAHSTPKILKINRKNKIKTGSEVASLGLTSAQVNLCFVVDRWLLLVWVFPGATCLFFF